MTAKPQSKPGILYISYDGMLEPLGQSQVLSYLEQLAGQYRIRLISFEKKSDWSDSRNREKLRERIASAGIAWIPLRYHKAPTAPATAYDIIAGTITALYQVLRHRISVVHARSYVAAAIALPIKRLAGSKFLFDMRGFWADERLDAGIWPQESRIYRWAKQLERHFLLGADHIVTLTHASAREIRNFSYLQDKPPRISVIPTCADLNLFRRQGPTDPSFTLGFVGAVGWSEFDEILNCFKAVQEEEPRARLLIVNRNEHDFIRARIAASGIDPAKVEVAAASHGDMPRLISRMTAGVVLKKPTYSQLACAPTKLAEYLGCGVPCLANEGIGDVQALLEEARVGVVLHDFSTAEMRSGVRRLMDLVQEQDIEARCVAAARRHFSLEYGVRSFSEIYRLLTHPPHSELDAA